MRRALMTLVMAFFLALPLSAFSQTCPLCYAKAASAKERIREGLRSGVLILVIPPMFMSIGITWLAFSKRNQFHDNAPPADEADCDR